MVLDATHDHETLRDLVNHLFDNGSSESVYWVRAYRRSGKTFLVDHLDRQDVLTCKDNLGNARASPKPHLYVDVTENDMGDLGPVREKTEGVIVLASNDDPPANMEGIDVVHFKTFVM